MEVEETGGFDMIKKIKKALLIIIALSVILPSFIYVFDKLLAVVGRKTKYTMLSGVYYNLIYVFTPCSSKVKKFSDKYMKFEYTPVIYSKVSPSYNSEEAIFDDVYGSIRISIIKKEYVIEQIQEVFSRKIISDDGSYCILDCGKIPLNILKKLKNKELDYETLKCLLTIPAGKGLIHLDMPWLPDPEYLVDEITIRGLKFIRIFNKYVDNIIYLYGMTKKGNIILIALRNSNCDDYKFFHNFVHKYLIFSTGFPLLTPPEWWTISQEKQSTCAFKKILDTIEISDEI